MKMLRVLLLVTLVAGLALAVQPTKTQAQENGELPNLDCEDVAAAFPSSLLARSVWGTFGYHAAGPYIFSITPGSFLTSATVQLTDGRGNVLAGPAAVPTTLTVDMSGVPQPSALELQIVDYRATAPASTINISVSCGGGCTTMVPIPEQAVVGKFNWNSELYWAPGHQVQPMTYVEAGNTYYVAGQDESEEYYKILIACEWYWVRKDTVGPNYDEVWQGQPLPTEIVE